MYITTHSNTKYCLALIDVLVRNSRQRHKLMANWQRGKVTVIVVTERWGCQSLTIPISQKFNKKRNIVHPGLVLGGNIDQSIKTYHTETPTDGIIPWWLNIYLFKRKLPILVDDLPLKKIRKTVNKDNI